jgi:nicotinamidase-related amidase
MKRIHDRLVLETLEEIADPKHTAVLVIDVQNDSASPKGFLASKGVDISMARKTIPRIKTILEEARRLKLLIIFMRMTRSKDGSLEAAPRLRLLEKGVHTRGGTEYEREGTWGNEVLDELEPRPNERQFIKHLSSSFIGTPLDSILRNRGIKTAVVVGSVTEGCVETTVRDLEQYGYYPVVLRDCVSSRRQDLHDAALLVMSARYDVVNSEELLRLWRSAVPDKY